MGWGTLQRKRPFFVKYSKYRKSPQIRSAPKIELKKKYSGLGADLSCKNHAKNPRIWTGIKPEIVHFR